MLAAAAAFFVFVPDRTVSVVIYKLPLAGVLAALPPGSGRRRWLKVMLPWASFTFLVGLATLLPELFSASATPFPSAPLRGYFSLALRSFWLVNLAYSASLSFSHPEMVRLCRRLPLGRRAAYQLLLVVTTWEKLLAEFGRVPLAWKSRGVRKGGGRPLWTARRLFQAAILRSLDKAFRLETALLSRGFQGKFYTLRRDRWRPADGLALLLAAVVLAGLLTGGLPWS